jgi:hypothetical protein
MSDQPTTRFRKLHLFIGASICLLICAPATCWICGSTHKPAAHASVPSLMSPEVSGSVSVDAPGSDFDARSFKRIKWSLLTTWEFKAPNSPSSPRDSKGPRQTAGQTQPSRKIPDDILAWKGKKVVIEGFMQPFEVTEEGVKNFALVPSQPCCCFAAMPQMNSWIDAKMVGDEQADYVPNEPVDAYGTLDVGPQFEDGYVLSLYRLKVERVFGAE